MDNYVSLPPFASLRDQRFLVTGATSGLGLEIARQIAALHGMVILVGRENDRLQAALRQLPGTGHAVEIRDLSEVDSIPSWMDEVAMRHGKLNGVVHSAGIMIIRPLKVIAVSDWEKSFKINVIAASMLAKGFRKANVRAETANIVFLASAAAMKGQAAQSIYSATKGALIAMTRSLAVELAPESIRVNSVAPAVVDAGMSNQIKAGVTEARWSAITQQHPLGLGKPSDVAASVAFLLSDSARWITGTTLVVDGGYSAQ